MGMEKWFMVKSTSALAEGLGSVPSTNMAACDRLDIRQHTVHTYRRNIFNTHKVKPNKMLRYIVRT